MPNPSSARPDALAAIIVFGHTPGSDLPQASWFKAEDSQAARTAAEQMKFSAIELKTEAERALVAGVHEGVLKGSGRMIVGSVTLEIYRRLEEHARKTSGSPLTASKPNEDLAHTTGVSSEAIAAGDLKPGAGAALSGPATQRSPDHPGANVSPAAPWDSLRIGGVVLAAYWNEKKELEGFWPAVITRLDKNEFVLKWRDTPEYPLGKLARKYIAILHPDFVASGE